jgi:hypothetical protein
MSGLTRRRLFKVAAAGTVGAAAAPALARPRRARGTWLAGDLHSHTVLSHDVWGGPDDDNTDLDEAYTFGFTAGEQIRNAELRGLDFLAITDHNRTDALRLPEYRSARLALIPAYEHSLAGGHAGVFVPDAARLADIVRDTDGSTAFAGDDGAARFLDAVHALGGVAVLNHPFYGNEDQGEKIAWDYGLEVSRRFDAVEVWNIGWPARHDVLPFADSDNYLSLPWWESQILTARRVGAVGGSDSHWRLSSTLNGVGQPTTWVYAHDRSPAALLRAVREGRTFISAEPPGLGGARLLLSAREEWGNRSRAAVGESVGAQGPLQARVRVLQGGGSRLRLVSTGMVMADEPVLLPDQTFTFRVVLPPHGWLRAELYVDRGYFMTALTSPIYAAGRAPARRRARRTDGEPAAYGHPTKRQARPSTLVQLRRRAGCSC